MNYAIKVVKNGKEEFLTDGFPAFRPTKFPSRAAAQRQADAMKPKATLVVPYPKDKEPK